MIATLRAIVTNSLAHASFRWERSLPGHIESFHRCGVAKFFSLCCLAANILALWGCFPVLDSGVPTRGSRGSTTRVQPPLLLTDLCLDALRAPGATLQGYSASVQRVHLRLESLFPEFARWDSAGRLNFFPGQGDDARGQKSQGSRTSTITTLSKLIHSLVVSTAE